MWVGHSQKFAFCPKWHGMPLGAFEQRVDSIWLVFNRIPQAAVEGKLGWIKGLQGGYFPRDTLLDSHVPLPLIDEIGRIRKVRSTISSSLSGICPPEKVHSEPRSAVQKLREAGFTLHRGSVVFLFFLILFFFISWRLITLQYCSGFCHTLKWISHGFTCVPHPDPPSHLPLHPIPLGLPSAPGPSTCLMHPTWAGDLFHPR